MRLKTGKKQDLTRVGERERRPKNCLARSRSQYPHQRIPGVRCIRPARRKISAHQKHVILDAVDACSELHEIGANVRKEGSYSVASASVGKTGAVRGREWSHGWPCSALVGSVHGLPNYRKS